MIAVLRHRGSRLLTFALAFLASTLTRESGSSAVTQAVIWLPSGVAIAGLWLLGQRACWVVAAATLLHRLLIGYAIGSAVGSAVGTTLEAVVGVVLLRRLGLRADFARLRDVLILFAAAALAPLLSIACSWIARSLPGSTWAAPVTEGWGGWWRMNALGVLTVVPLALTWLGRPWRPRLQPCLVAAAIAVAIVGVLWSVMALVRPGPTAIMLLYMVLPLALFAAIRFGPRGAAGSAALGALFVALEACSTGASFITIPYAERHAAIQVFLVTLVGVPLVIGSLIAEREASVSLWLQSEGLRRALLQVLPDTSYRIGADATLLDVYAPDGSRSPQRQALIGKKLGEVAPPAVAGRMLAALAAALQGVRPEPIEYRFEEAGRVRMLEARFVQLTHGEVLGVVRDISKRKRAEHMLAWQAGILELIATGRANAEVFLALVRGIEQFDDQCLGSILLLQGRRLHVACAPSLPAEYNAAVDGLEVGPQRGSCGTAAHDNRTVVVADVEHDPLWAGATALPLRHGLRACWSLPIRSQHGDVLGTFAVYYRTVRAPAAGELALVERAAVLAGLAIDRERREDLLASLNRNVVEGLFRSLPGRGLVYVNRAFARLFGYESPEAMLGAAPAANPQHRQDLERLAGGAIAGGGEELRLHRRDGSSFWGLVSCTAVHAQDGSVTSYDGAVVDVTTRRQLEEQLRQAQKMEAVGKLAGGVAHDFNNILTVITGYAETLLRALPPGSDATADAEQVLEAAERAAGLTRQLLAFSRQQVLSPQVLDLAAIVDQLGGMLRRVIGEDVELRTQASGRPLYARVDRGQIEQVILNLVVNARDAMPHGGQLLITTAAVEIDEEFAAHHVDLMPGPHVVLTVRDTGVGMTRDVLARAFDPFFTTKEQGKGTGLGLATVYGIVRQSGGAVWFDSTPGQGTTAWIHLPRVEAPAPTPAPSTEPLPRAAPATVLVVEDDPFVRELVHRTLQLAGYAVLLAEDGQAALELARAGAEFELLVTDLVMPRLGGRELAEQLLRDRPGLPVLYMSGYAGQEPAAGLGPGEFLQKPFHSADLLAQVVTLLAGRARVQRG